MIHLSSNSWQIKLEMIWIAFHIHFIALYSYSMTTVNLIVSIRISPNGKTKLILKYKWELTSYERTTSFSSRRSNFIITEKKIKHYKNATLVALKSNHKTVDQDQGLTAL